MSDTAHVEVRSRGGSVFLTTNFNGSELPDALRAGLHAARAAGYLNDDGYLARIIFCHMMDPSELYEPRGYSISPEPDGADREIVVSTADGTVEGPDYNIELQSIDQFIGFTETEDDEDDEIEELRF